MRAHSTREHRIRPIVAALALACFGTTSCDNESKQKSPKQGPERESASGPTGDGGNHRDGGDAGITPKVGKPMRPRRPSAALRVPPVDPRYQPTPKETSLLDSAGEPVVELAANAGWQARVAVPVGAKEQRPVLLVLTPNPDPTQCEHWTAAAQQGAFTICIGAPTKLGEKPPSAKGGTQARTAAWGAAIRGALEQVKEHFPQHLASGSIVTVAYSEIAAMAVELGRESPKFFSRLVLAGSTDPGWDAALADHFAAQGGQRVLFLCEGAACTNHARRGATWLKTATLASRIVSLEGANLKSQLSWLVTGDPRWAFLDAKATPDAP